MRNHVEREGEYGDGAAHMTLVRAFPDHTGGGRREERNLHALPAKAPRIGLTEEEAQNRKARGQGNVMPVATTRTYRAIFSENIFTFINLSIILLGILLAFMGRAVDAFLSGGAIAVN